MTPDREELERLVAELRTEPRCQCGTLRDPDQSTVTDDAADALESLLTQLSEAEAERDGWKELAEELGGKLDHSIGVYTLPKEGTSHEQ